MDVLGSISAASGKGEKSPEKQIIFDIHIRNKNQAYHSTLISANRALLLLFTHQQPVHGERTCQASPAHIPGTGSDRKLRCC